MDILNTFTLKSNRQIKIKFDGGDLSSDAGLLLIKEFAAKIGLNYSWISIRPNNCTMSSKIDSGSSNYSEIICQKGIKSLWQFLEELFSCQGSLIVAIPAVHTVCWYLPAFHKTHFCRGSCYTAWMWYILLSGLFLQQSSAVLNGRYQYAV